MKVDVALKGNYAVSEIVGGMILVLIAVITFSVIYIYLFPPGPDYDINVKIEGSVSDDGLIMLKHVGGNPLESYRVTIYHPNGTYIGTKIITDDCWKIGEFRYPLENITDIKLIDESITLRIGVYSFNKDGTEQEIFSWEPCGRASGASSNCPILISSLKTNTVDEDLICYSYPITPDVNATTYIYNWKVNNNPLAELIMPFDTNSNTTTRDYSGNGLDGLVRDCEWTENGVVGGAYHFGGSKEHIVIESDLPPCFNDFANNDFTVSIWVNSSFMSQDNKIILEGRKDTKNFVRLYQENDGFNFGVCINDSKVSVRTENVQSNIWYHIAGVWDASEQYLAVYLNGVISTERGDNSFSCGAHDGLSIGHGNSGSGGYWYGYLDEVEIYNRVLSSYQIYQIYLSQKDGQYDRRVFVSEETALGEIWQCIVTPNDSSQDGTPVESNTLQIVNYPGGD